MCYMNSKKQMYKSAKSRFRGIVALLDANINSIDIRPDKMLQQPFVYAFLQPCSKKKKKKEKATIAKMNITQYLKFRNHW